MNKEKEFYRYHDYHDRFGCHIELSVYVLLRETKCGYWITNKCFSLYDELMKEQYKRWISKQSVKRFAYPTKEEAFDNFKKRKERQIFLSKLNITKATEALSKAENVKI